MSVLEDLYRYLYACCFVCRFLLQDMSLLSYGFLQVGLLQA
jgi:hypothetical protein